MAQLAYLYDGTLEGLFSCVFESYARREVPEVVCMEHELQCAFEQLIRDVPGDFARAARVQRGIVNTCGEEIYRRVQTCFLSVEPDRAARLLRYMRLGFERGRAVEGMLAHPDVAPIEAMFLHICREAHRFQQFVRFERMENGVYFSQIHPVNRVLPLIMPHFSDRFSDQPFLIYDASHQMAGIYDLTDWYLADTSGRPLNLPGRAEGEAEWKAMFKRFYESIAIPERRNEKLRRAFCPKRYWEDMPEMPTVIRR